MSGPGVITTIAGQTIKKLVNKRKREEYQNYLNNLEKKDGAKAIEQMGENAASTKEKNK